MNIGKIGKDEVNVNFWRLAALYVGLQTVSIMVFMTAYLILLVLVLLIVGV
jgi:hypothetical protein